MDTPRWERIESLFFAALERDAAERTAFLDALCVDDPALRREVEAMLAAHEPARMLLLEDRLLDEAGAAETLIGARIGPYRIVEEIGRGGMGRVYLAERADEQFRQRVALKLVKRGMDTDAILHRFRQERQILASLAHPGIARLYDGGVAGSGAGSDPGGRPYFAMEYVEDGVAIDVFCDTHRLPVAERLRLFLSVCRAVQYAHQNLVVHRDLKPSNILVAADGTPKLLDFGIAKLLDPALSPFSVTLTQAETRVMTPEYAAPEQVRGEAITTATDVYQLGVLLYELLTGCSPYRLRRRTPDEIAKVICETEPERPSSAVARTAEVTGPDGAAHPVTPAMLSTARGTEPAALRRRLRGDLDTIVLKAMAKEPERRYPSVETLDADVQRFLEGRPVQARPAGVGYRVGKFVRRYTLGVAAAAALILLLLAFALVMAVQNARIEQQAQAIAHERDRAEAVSLFLAKLFEGADPTRTPDPAITAREMLAQGVEKVRVELKDQRDVQAQLLTLIGGVYRKLGLYDEARRTLDEAIAAHRAAGNEPEALGTALLEQANLAYRLDRFAEAEPLLREALLLKRKALGEEHPEVAGILNSLALVVEEEGRIEEAKALLRQVIAIRRSQHATEPNTDLAANLNNLALILHDEGQLDEAEVMYREALDILEARWGPSHPYIAFLLNSYAGVHQDRGDYARAEADFSRSLDIAHALLGEAHPFTAVLYHNRARLAEAQGRSGEAVRYYRRAVDLRRRILPGHPDLAESLYALGHALAATDSAAVAAEPLREASTLYHATLGPASRQTRQVDSMLATLAR